MILRFSNVLRIIQLAQKLDTIMVQADDDVPPSAYEERRTHQAALSKWKGITGTLYDLRCHVVCNLISNEFLGHINHGGWYLKESNGQI